METPTRHYLDNAASTPMRSTALDVMVPLLSDTYGNPSGAHRMARDANRVLDEARETLAEALGCEPGEIVFTGGGTEADNLAIAGVIEATGGVPVCSAVEHHAVLEPVHHLGGRVVAVGTDGRIDLEALAATLSQIQADGGRVGLLSLMLANNETGVVQPLTEAAAVAREIAPDVVVHTDAIQALCWLDVAKRAADADLISVSGHKFGGPKGVGALVVRGRPALVPQLKGGSQERGRRGGTHNVAGIAAMAAAAAETVAERQAEIERVSALRDRLVEGIKSTVEGVVESGVDVPPGQAPVPLDRANKTANVAHLCFEGVASEALLFLLERQGIMASAASSCSSGAAEPSHVLAAMGYGRDLAFGSLRLSLGHTSTSGDVDAALAAIPPAVARLRGREVRPEGAGSGGAS